MSEEWLREESDSEMNSRTNRYFPRFRDPITQVGIFLQRSCDILGPAPMPHGRLWGIAHLIEIELLAKTPLLADSFGARVSVSRFYGDESLRYMTCCMEIWKRLLIHGSLI